jgi:Fuc2NAc and GlcNAc transferase
MGHWTAPLGLAGSVGAALFIVWCVNLYNFMDGIDGIAAGQGVVAALAGAALCGARGDLGLACAALTVAGANAGFLVWNWAPARIFMGDVGSGLLGFLFAVLGLAAEREGAVPLLAWVLLFAPFVADATITLIRRVARREAWYAAHRSHAYQRAVQAGWPHARVSAATMALAVGEIPLAAAATWYPAALVPALLVSAGVLGGTYIWLERVRPMVRGA